MANGKSWGAEFTVYSGDIKKVVKQLNKLKNSTPNNLRNAVNRAATKSRNLLFKEAKAGYTLKDLAKEDIRIFRASPSRPIAEFKIQGRPRLMIEYEHTPNTSGRHGTGIRAKVLKKASMKELRRPSPGGAAFIAPGGANRRQTCAKRQRRLGLNCEKRRHNPRTFEAENLRSALYGYR